ncbi:MAG: FtsW/RodA/SpoVE family cell cycle protein [Eubacteriales bacterium]|nr:FtsW/RodA/SpoVE family cell cycle protein [Eubacteriales bacterium]
MEMHEYLKLCTGQIRCKTMRPVVEKELRAHIEDQQNAYLENGMAEKDAMRLAVEQMGDPVETGNALDRIHRPKMDWKTAGIILLLALIGFLAQYAYNREYAETVALSNYIKSTAAGIVCMFAICFADYTILGKYPRLIWCLLTALCVLANLTGPRVNGMVRCEWIVMLLVPSFAGIVFFYREQRALGIVKALAWILGTGAVLLTVGPDPLMAKVWLCGCFVMLGYAVGKGWYHTGECREMTGRLQKQGRREVEEGRRRRHLVSALILGMPAVGAFGAAVVCLAAGGFKAQRIRALLDPYAYESGGGYGYVQVRKALQGLKAVGEARTQSDAGWLMEQWENFALLNIAGKYGLLAGILILVCLFVLAGALVNRIRKLSNRLGAVVSVGCFFVFLVSVVFHALMNAGYFPSTACSLPFISMNGKQNVCLYILMGILLSVFRSRNTRPEPQSVWEKRMPQKADGAGKKLLEFGFGKKQISVVVRSEIK